MAESPSELPADEQDGFVPTRSYLLGEIAFVLARVWMLQEHARQVTGAGSAGARLEDAGYALSAAYTRLGGE